MSNSSLYFGGVSFQGEWSVAGVYNVNDVVEGISGSSYGSAYKCNINGTTGAIHDPSTDSVNWSLLVPGAEPITFIVDTVTNVSAITTFGINDGSTSEWVGSEWVLSNVGSTVTLTKISSNCNCNCSIVNCTALNCDCYTDCNCIVNCNCAANCNCIQYQISPCYCNCNECSTTVYGYDNLCTCVTNCNCYTNCNCATGTNCAADCNCATNCDCNCAAI